MSPQHRDRRRRAVGKDTDSEKISQHTSPRCKLAEGADFDKRMHMVKNAKLSRCTSGPDKDNWLHAPPANNKDPQPHTDLACSSTGGFAVSNGRIFPTWCPALRNPPCGSQCSTVSTQLQEMTHTCRVSHTSSSPESPKHLHIEPHLSNHLMLHYDFTERIQFSVTSEV
ncbi:hypothetical protein Q5P01_008099 [Channa striata]|uniref:Uncharacterized protein n=1 Tax=Channa striata TaxID=64152 RepID=A0AA88N632_CHASR|nr:hypothetical protein Q5P01_008099 [Channa striata]